MLGRSPELLGFTVITSNTGSVESEADCVDTDASGSPLACPISCGLEKDREATAHSTIEDRYLCFFIRISLTIPDACVSLCYDAGGNIWLVRHHLSLIHISEPT